MKIMIPDPLGSHIKGIAAHLGMSATELVKEAVEIRLREIAKQDIPGRVLRAHGWRERKAVAP